MPGKIEKRHCIRCGNVFIKLHGDIICDNNFVVKCPQCGSYLTHHTLRKIKGNNKENK